MESLCVLVVSIFGCVSLFAFAVLIAFLAVEQCWRCIRGCDLMLDFVKHRKEFKIWMTERKQIRARHNDR